MGSIPLLILGLLALTISYSNAEIVKDPTLCGRLKCQVADDPKFKYQDKLFYQYRYRVDVGANLGEAVRAKNESRMYIDADVTLRFLTPCDGQLRFANVSISHDRRLYQPDFPDRAGAEFKAGLERHALRFAFHDGLVRELCPEPRDEPWALNVRRGVLSMLQNTMLRFDVDRRHEELDVHGVCETSYRLHEARRTSLVLRKSKSLATCRQAGKHLSLVQSHAYRSPLARVHALRQPLVASSSECDITIDHNVYQRVSCVDRHRLRPLANGDGTAGARTEVLATLDLVAETASDPFAGLAPIDDNDQDGQLAPSDEPSNRSSASGSGSSGTAPAIIGRRTSLLYDHGRSSRTIYGELRASRDLLKTMCVLGTPQELRDRFSETFTRFVHSARMLDYQGLSQLYQRSSGICKTGKKHIVNALPFIGSNAAVALMKDLIVKKQVSKDKIDYWITAITLIPRPDRQTILALAPLLEHRAKIPQVQFVLSYSAVIHSYCSNHEPRECLDFEPVKKFMRFVEDNVEKGCRPRAYARADVKQTLEALKAIGNAGVETETLSRKLRQCISDESGFIPMEVKIAAVEAHRRLPSCEKSRDQFFLANYRNFTVDAELRIASYLQVMRCPDYNVIKIIRHTLEEEEVNQVGSFVWSHLKNQLTSSSPSRIEIQSLLTDRDLGNKFNSDLRKFSRSYESSFFSEEYNFGANQQTNLVFSPKSYVPRTVNFNLTVDLFGESVNLFEVGMRAEGLEFYAESLFGPKGPFSGVKVADHFRQFVRQFRDAKPEDDGREYWKKVKALPNVIDNDFDQPRVSLSYKIFGNELKFVMLETDEEIRTTLASLNPWEKIKQILSGKEIVHYENYAMFLDSSYVLPTTAGLPVRLDIAGSAACNIKLSGILNSQKFMSDGELEINGNIMPSVSVDVTGSMKVDAFYKSAGLKLKNSVYSIGAVEADLKIKGLKLARLSWKIPNHKMEVFSLTTDIMLVTSNGAETKEQPIGLPIPTSDKESSSMSGRIIKNTTCSWSALDKLVGLKLCADYQFPNVTKDESASYFLLNGPTIFKLSLIKADPTADSYLLEYKWKRTVNESTIRVAFDTPGSQTEREISATLSFDALNNNVLLLLKSKGNSLIAQGTYKRTNDETFVDIGLDSNGTKHLGASVGYSRKKAKHGYTYFPKVYLAINNERIVNLSGAIRSQDKADSGSQCDIDLRFETKNLASRVLGYVARTNASVQGNVKIDYRFHANARDEVLQTEFSLINRSTKQVTYKSADMKLHSTAYPQLNVVAGLRYQHALGQVELQLEVNTSPHLHNPDRHKLVAEFVAAYSKPYFQTDGANVSAHVAIRKPVQDIDIKVGVDYRSVGPESKTVFLVRYAPNKEITLAVDIVMPRGTLLVVDGRANLTVPNFNSMLLSAKINERARNEYELDFAGTWFSGHNLSAKGSYYDRSTASVTNHDLKMLLRSPSFAKDVLVTCQLYRDVADLRLGLDVEQIDMDRYALALNHTSLTARHFRTFLEARYKNSTYSMSAEVDTQREANVKLHLHKWRDVHLTAVGINEESRKEAGLEIKWDAARDPNLKFLTNFHLSRFSSLDRGRNLSAVMRISYPGRSLVGSCLLAQRPRNNYVLDTILEWNVDRAIRFSLDTDLDNRDSNKILKLESQLLTPFENWKKTSLNGKYLQTEQDLEASGSIYWQDSQHVIFDVTGQARRAKDNLTSEYSANAGLLSTVHAIQCVTVNLTHVHVHGRSADSRLLIKYHPDKVIDARSVWLIDSHGSDDSFNVTGNLQLTSPVVNYKKGELKCHLSSRPNWRFYGAANLELDKRKYTGHLVGDLARLKESMVQLNVTTPFEKYSFVRARFGLSERNRHVVAEVATPAGPLGIEGICQLFTSSYDFNVKLLVATPIDVLQQALLVAKLNQREADFRIAYNDITAGFQGVWFYHNITSFHYSYILYTPLQGFDEIGIITKLVVEQKEPSGMIDVDTEFSLRVVELKAGIKAHAGPKPLPPVAIPSKPDLSKVTNTEEDNQETYDFSDEFDSSFSWKGDLDIDLVIVETLSASVDYERDGALDKVLAIVKLPVGNIVLEDRFTLEDFFHIKNELSIDTPFPSASEIVSLYNLDLDIDKSEYLMDLSFNIRNYSTWIESGFNINYTSRNSEDSEQQIHMLKFDMKTPLRFLLFLKSNSVIEIDENLYKANVSMRSVESLVDFLGSVELDTHYLDVNVEAKLDSPIMSLAKTKFNAKKDFTDKEKHIEIILDVFEPTVKNSKFAVSWLIDDGPEMKGSIFINTWIEPIINVEAEVDFNNNLLTENSADLVARLSHHKNQEYKLTGRLKDNKVDAEIDTTGKRYVFNGDLKTISTGLFELVGTLKNLDTDEVYDVVGPIKYENDAFSSVDLTISSKAAGSTQQPTKLSLNREKYGISFTSESHRINSSLKMNLVNPYNWDVRVAVAPVDAGSYDLVTFMNVQVNGNTTLYVEAETPWPELAKLVLDGNLLLDNRTGYVRVAHRLNHEVGRCQFAWRLFYMSDMFAQISAGRELDGSDRNKDVVATVFYANPQRAFKHVETGFDIDVDKEQWRFGTKVSVGAQDQSNVDALLTIRLPPPDADTHNLILSYHVRDEFKDLDYVVGYKSDVARSNYASDGSLKMSANDVDGHLRLAWGTRINETLNNVFNVTFDSKTIDLKYSLFTPLYEQEETLVLLAGYDSRDEDRTLLRTDINYPGQKRIGSAKLFYESLININGTLNASTSFPHLSEIGCEFVIVTTLKENKRFVQLSWPNNTALVDSFYAYNSERLDSNLDGHLRAEVPLSTRHCGLFTYGYKKRPLHTQGYSEFVYNEEKIMQGSYQSKSESRAGFERDRIQIGIENALMPLGIVYLNEFEYSAGNYGTNYPTVEFKEVNVYQLNNATAFNVTGQSRIRTTHTGQRIELQAVHSNRTVKFKTDYDVLPGEFDQNCWFSLAEDAWISYRINVLNKTTEDAENQFMVLSVVYPRRNFTLDGSYSITTSALNAEAKLIWDSHMDRAKDLGLAFDWTNSTESDNEIARQKAVLSFRHPSFKKDVRFIGTLARRDSRDLLNVGLVVDYSAQEDKLVQLQAVIRDESDLPTERKYSYRIRGEHPKTQLKLDMKGHARRYRSELAETYNDAKYKRSFLPEECGMLMGRVDLSRNEVEFRRESNDLVKYLQARYYPTYPRYSINGSAVNGHELNATADFFIDFDDKMTKMMVNYTPDAVESLRMYGSIPDARNAHFDIWRTYDQDLQVSDVTFYLRLNHSRLVTSKMKWRPELKSDVVNAIRSALSNSYQELSKDLDYWRHYVRSETVSVISDIWTDAQDELEDFLEDLNELRVIEGDFENLKIYLNKSYQANDFYIKDIVATAIYAIDELALRSHIQSLPNIINEIWEIMGESGQAVRDSLLWIIETVKQAYRKLSEIAGAILRGDSMNQIASIVEKIIIKYDMFVKDLHVSFIKYIEHLYNKIYQSIALQWHRFLMHMEPIFIQLAHYLETVTWRAVQEFFNFLYDRKLELITSPYYDHFSNFTQDIDKFYRDVKANDIITNIQKYSSSVIQFLKERYFAFVPFGKELKDVVEEIFSELQELQKLPSVKYATEKLGQLRDRAVYLWEYLEVRAKLETTIRLVHAKLMDISQTALQAESRYREAKTKFVYDPNNGLMLLEQKLPMSWHAFNQTPEFQEIPEYRALADMGSYFAASNTTFWTLYYQIKPLTEPTNWLPPFKAQAMIIGAQHLRTFDGRHLDFAGSCSSYLLARDFVRDSFALLIKYKVESDGRLTHRLVVLVGRHAVELDIFNDSVRLLGEDKPLQMPMELDNGSVFVYQDESLVSVERADKQLKLECNLKYEFCNLELSGWYYGKTAGLLGTMNNEPSDDHLASTGRVERGAVGRFAQSWSLDPECSSSSDAEKAQENLARSAPVTSQLSRESDFCQQLFGNKSSEFGSCFPIVEPSGYLDVCARSLDDREACAVAMAYLQTCMFHDTYLRIPNRCTTCSEAGSGLEVPEGEFRKLGADKQSSIGVPQSVDTIFIVEAKECNRAIGQNRSIDQLLQAINKELQEAGMRDNRWSLVTFGGRGVYEKARSLVVDNAVFARDAARFAEYFERVPVAEGGSQDIFEAIRFAAQLSFRAGVAKTFVLMPCSKCDPDAQTLDYSTLYHALQERGISLHILMDGEFHFDKGRLSKIFYGLDAQRSYTRKDARVLSGDPELRRQVRLSKSALGYCMPLALETNGTIFAGAKLRQRERAGALRKFCAVFAKRLALTARPSPCQHCECIANNDGLSKMECAPCDYPMPITVDFETTDNDDDISTMQGGDLDYDLDED
ncbi:uncharacterized protein LOC106652091 isoform X2 [Trichogramma pretiosum]|uniref:uncharacterized protein LOC106652091 isoform X2 n=1 Tax=Trichogramma pretiosum TaxID=7493 RepID=UPI0006C93C91|nr:uncharacterized protein LOC106652091 isoform X2 [Trichogramma pretiosum]